MEQQNQKGNGKESTDVDRKQKFTGKRAGRNQFIASDQEIILNGIAYRLPDIEIDVKMLFVKKVKTNNSVDQGSYSCKYGGLQPNISHFRISFDVIFPAGAN